MGKDEGAAVLLEAAALTYARAIEAWQAGFPGRDTNSEDAAAAQRAIAEARAQLYDAARRVGLASGKHYADLYGAANSPAPWKLIAHNVRQNNTGRMKRDDEQPLFGNRDRDRIEADLRRMERFYWLALAGEVGEGCNLVKKFWRDGPRWDDEKRKQTMDALRVELCDVRIYVEALADLYGMDLDAECEKKMRRVMERPFAQAAQQDDPAPFGGPGYK